MITAKVCFKCGQEKNLDEFYKHPRMADGHLGKCKECTRQDVCKNRVAKRDYYIQYDRTRTRTARRRTQLQATTYRMRQRYPDRYKARTTLHNSIRDGHTQRQPCEICGEPNTEGHHEDYEAPLDVRWLCGEHHRMLHLARKRGLPDPF